MILTGYEQWVPFGTALRYGPSCITHIHFPGCHRFRYIAVTGQVTFSPKASKMPGSIAIQQQSYDRNQVTHFIGVIRIFQHLRSSLYSSTMSRQFVPVARSWASARHNRIKPNIPKNKNKQDIRLSLLQFFIPSLLLSLVSQLLY